MLVDWMLMTGSEQLALVVFRDDNTVVYPPLDILIGRTGLKLGTTVKFEIEKCGLE